MNPEHSGALVSLKYATTVLAVEMGLIHDWLQETFETSVLNRDSVHYKNVHKSTDEMKMIRKTLDMVVKVLKSDDHVRRQLFPNEVEAEVEISDDAESEVSGAPLNESNGAVNSLELEPFSSRSEFGELSEQNSVSDSEENDESPVEGDEADEEVEEEEETDSASAAGTNIGDIDDVSSSLTESTGEEDGGLRGPPGRTPGANRGDINTRIEIAAFYSNARRPAPPSLASTQNLTSAAVENSDEFQDLEEEDSSETLLEPIKRVGPIPARINQKTNGSSHRKKLRRCQEKEKILHKCQFCKKSFAQKHHKNAHERIHTGEKPFNCQFCNRKFTQLGDKVKHERIHTGEKPFKCQFCNRKFTQLGHKLTHERIHTGEKPFKCQFCNRKFTDLSSKIKHERIHTGVRPYECEFCDKRFVQLSQRVCHLLIHTREKPHRCQLCQKSFTSKACLLKHERCRAHLSRVNQWPAMRADNLFVLTSVLNVMPYNVFQDVIKFYAH